MSNPLLTAIRPSTPTDTPLRKFSEWTGTLGLLIFAFCSLLSIAAANLGLIMMLVALLLSPDAWRRLWREPLFGLSMLTIGYIALHAVVSAGEFPDIRKTISNQSRDWAWLFLFVIPGWWMSRGPHRIYLALSLMLSGFVLGILISLDSSTIDQLMRGMRSGLHFGKPIIFGFDCAVGMLAVVSLIYHLMSHDAPQEQRFRGPLIAISIIVFLVFIQGLVVSQSRGVWLAALVSIPFTLILLFKGHHSSQPRSRGHFGVIIAGLAMLALAIALNWNTITQRLSYENEELGIVVSQGLEQAPLGSSTYRLHLWRFGINKWLERPLLGWGPGTTYSLVAAENSESLKSARGIFFDHLHNAYLEVLFQLGLIGVALVSVIAVLLLRICFASYRAGVIPKPLFAFLLGNFVLIAVYSLTDFRHLHWNWRFYWMILAGAILSLQLFDSSAGQETP